MFVEGIIELVIKQCKNVFAVVLSLCIIASIAGDAFSSGRETYDVSGALHSTGELNLSKKNLTTSSDRLHIPEKRYEYYKDFIINIYDGKKGRILLCDFVFEIGNRTKEVGEKVDVRKTIYKFSKKIEKRLPSLIEAKDVLKTEIKYELNKNLKEEAIKEIYITKFVLL